MNFQASKIFVPGDIIIPADCDMEKWSVIACDQFTSEISYWEEVQKIVGNAPSTLHMILPEAFLGKVNENAERMNIYRSMTEFLQKGKYKEIKNSYIYVKRRLENGLIRRGLIGCLDLEAYSFETKTNSCIRATEGTVMKRLPPRVSIRESAALELPHVMVFVDDPENILLSDDVAGDKLYDFDLMMRGGHIQGYLVKDINEIKNRLEKLSAPAELRRKYGESEAPILFAIGDGNHSLAAAKLCWEDMKKRFGKNMVSETMRYALVEIVNIHDPAVIFEPIHKVLFKTNNGAFLSEFQKTFSDCLSLSEDGESSKKVEVIAGKEKVSFYFNKMSVRIIIKICEEFISLYSSEYGGTIDYIHGSNEAREKASHDNNAGLIMPTIDKTQLFASVMKEGVFPRKSFSIGNGRDKRYYLEARKIH